MCSERQTGLSVVAPSISKRRSLNVEFLNISSRSCLWLIENKNYFGFLKVTAYLIELLVILKNQARGHASGAVLVILSQKKLFDQGTAAITTRAGTEQKLSSVQPPCGQ